MADWQEPIRQARKQAGLTQPQLGERAGRSAESISKYENGWHRPPRGTLVRIARALDLAEDAAEQLLRSAGYATETTDRLDRLRRVRGSLEQLTSDVQRYPWPCLIINERYEIAGWNAAASAVAEFDFARELPELSQRNFLRIAIHPHFRPRVGNWDAVVSQIISMYKGNQADPERAQESSAYFAALVQEVLTGRYAGEILRLWGVAEPFQDGARLMLPIEWRVNDGTELRFNTVFTSWSDYDATFAHDWHPANAATWQWLMGHQLPPVADRSTPAASAEPPSVSPPWYSRLRSAREGAGLTRRQLARASGVSMDALYSWETGRRQPTAAHLRQLAPALALDTVTANAILAALQLDEEPQPSDWALFVAGLPPRNGSTWYETAGPVHRSWEQIAEDIAPLPWPCLVLNERCEATRWNELAARMLGSEIMGSWDRPRGRNLVRLLLGEPVRMRLANRDEAVRALVPATLAHALVETGSRPSPYLQTLIDLRAQVAELTANEAAAPATVRTVVPWRWRARDETILAFTAIAAPYNTVDPVWVIDFQPADAATWNWLAPSP